MKVLTIEKEKWRRGGPLYGDTALLNDRGLMCCLGFDALACGLKEDDIRNHADPSTLFEHLKETPDYAKEYMATRTNRIRSSTPQAVSDAIKINDNEALTDEERMKQLIPVLKQLGWDDVVFV